MGGQDRSYLAFMVRLWKVRSQGQLIWRVSLEDPHTGERKGFANLENFLAFLKEQMKDNLDPFTALNGERRDDG